MSGLFSSLFGGVDKKAKAPPPKEDEAAKAQAELRRRRQSARGFRSTLLSDQRGALKETLGG